MSSPEFVTRKISSSVAKIKTGKQELVELGNLSATRDWGYAPEYVSAMQIMLEHSEPQNFVVASGRTSSVRDYVSWSFAAAGIEVSFEGAGTEEKGYDKKTGSLLVQVNPDFWRADEEVPLIGNPTKIAETLGWRAEKTVEQLAILMVESDFESENGSKA